MYLITAEVTDYDEREHTYVLFLCKREETADKYVRELNAAAEYYKEAEKISEQKCLELDEKFGKILRPVSYIAKDLFIQMCLQTFGLSNEEAESKYKDVLENHTENVTIFNAKLAKYAQDKRTIRDETINEHLNKNCSPDLLATIEKYNLEYKFDNYHCEFIYKKLDIIELQAFE